MLDANAMTPIEAGHADAAIGDGAEAAYGLPEFCRSRVAGARLIANPGCYPTAMLLALAGSLDLPSVLVPGGVTLLAARSFVVTATRGADGAGEHVG